jgi:hypothetical protein
VQQPQPQQQQQQSGGEGSGLFGFFSRGGAKKDTAPQQQQVISLTQVRVLVELRYGENGW